MSASFIHRDPPVLNSPVLQMLSTKTGDIGEYHSDYSLSLSNRVGSRPYSDRGTLGKISPTTPPIPVHTQVSMQSPKMSPDSTLTHLPFTCAGSLSRFHQNSSAFYVSSSSVVSSNREGFFRSTLPNDCPDRQCVGSSTGHHMSNQALSMLFKPESDRSSRVPSPTNRPCTLPMPVLSRCGTPNGSNSLTTSSASLPTSTTPVKKSSRRNPWGPETYSDLITAAIHSYPDKQATLQQIYDFIIANHEYFQERSDPATSAGWKNSIRHNLSLHDRFTKCPKSSDNTKSSYWRINAEVASRPYVRRRACSMDATNLKRPLGCGKSGGRGLGGHRAARHSLSQNEKSLDSQTTRAMMPNLVHCPLPSLAETQYPNGIHIPSVEEKQQKLGISRSESKSSQPNGKISDYLRCPSAAMESDPDVVRSNSLSHWTHPKSAPMSRTCYTASSALPYSYQQLSGNLLMDPPECHSVVASTDQALVRSRPSSLIEHLLRADHLTANASSDSRSMNLSQSYLPNALFGNPMVTTVANNSRSNYTTTFLSTISSQPRPVDMRPQHLHARSRSPEVNNTSAHHLPPVHLSNHRSNHSHEAASAFTSHWDGCTLPFPSSISSVPANSNAYLNYNGCSSFEASSISSSSVSRPCEMKSSYDTVSSLGACSSNHTSRSTPFLPYVSSHAAPLSPSTNSSTSSSTRSWRHPLSLDLPTHVDLHPQTDALTLVSSSQATNSLDSHSLGPHTPPPCSVYYSPISQNVTNLLNPVDCALDTPPYHALKPEPHDADETLESSHPSSFVSANPNHTPTSYQVTDVVDPRAPYAHDIQGSTACSAIDHRIVGEFSYDEDDDGDKLELELSLAVADRIVASTRTLATK